jgi:hypothetical protein
MRGVAGKIPTTVTLGPYRAWLRRSCGLCPLQAWAPVPAIQEPSNPLTGLEGFCLKLSKERYGGLVRQGK